MKLIFTTVLFCKFLSLEQGFLQNTGDYGTRIFEATKCLIKILSIAPVALLQLPKTKWSFGMFETQYKSAFRCGFSSLFQRTFLLMNNTSNRKVIKTH